MVASSVSITILEDGQLLPSTIDQPTCRVYWSGGTGPFNVEWTWDDDPLFGDANGNRQTQTNNSVTSPDDQAPPSALADTSDGTTWYVKANVVDTGDSDNALSDDIEFTYDDPQLKKRPLYLLANVGVAFEPTDDPGDWGTSEGGTEGADGDVIDFERALYLLGDVGVGFKNTDQPFGGWGEDEGGNPDGGDGDEIEKQRQLYLLANVDSTQPCPYLFSLSAQTVDQGASLTVYGQGLVSATSPTADAYGAEVRLYDTTDLSGTYAVLAISSYADGETQDSITVTIPSNATSGWIAVVHTTNPTCTGSNFIGLNVISVEPDAEAGWWVEVWNLRNSERIISALPDVIQADLEHVPGDIGNGELLLPRNHEDIPDILDHTTTPKTQRLIKVYQHNRFSYSFIPDDIDEAYTDDGAAVARIFGKGQERMLKWGRALFKDYPSGVTRTRSRLYGSEANALPWIDGEVEPTNDNGGFEDGAREPWEKVGSPSTSASTSISHDGAYSLSVIPSALNQGVETQGRAESGRAVFADVWLRDNGPTYDKTLTIELLDNEGSTIDSTTISPVNSAWTPVNLDGISSVTGQATLRITQTAGTTGELWSVDDGYIYSRINATISRNRAQYMISRDYTTGGLHSVRIDFEASSLLKQVVGFAKVQPSQDYTLVLNVTGPVGAQVRIDMRMGNALNRIAHTFTGLGTWDQLTFSGTAGTEETVARFVITADTTTGFTMYLDGDAMTPGQPAANGGEISLDVLESMQARGTLDFVVAGYDREFDSAGLAWPETHPFEVPPEWSFWDLLDKLQGLGYRALYAPIDWRGGGDTGWELLLFAPGNSVIDHSQVQDGPALLPGGTVEDARPSSAAPLETVVYGEGPGGVWAVADLDAASLAALERREGFISNQAAKSATTVFRAASHRLTLAAERGDQFMANLTRDGDPLPYFDFLPEDALRAHLPSNTGRDHVPDDVYRVAAVLSHLTSSGRSMSWQVDFGNYGMYQARIMDLIVARMLERQASENWRPGSGSVSSPFSGSGGVGGFTGDLTAGEDLVSGHTHLWSDVEPAELGGDLQGALPDPQVVKVQGRDVSPSAPTDGQVLVWDAGSSQWVPDDQSGSGESGFKKLYLFGNG